MGLHCISLMTGHPEAGLTSAICRLGWNADNLTFWDIFGLGLGAHSSNGLESMSLSDKSIRRRGVRGP